MRPNLPSVIALCLLAVSAAGAQANLHLHFAVGGTYGKGAIPSREQEFVIAGPMGELGLELELARGNAIGTGAFGTANVQLYPIDNPTSGDAVRIGGRLAPLRYANTSGFYARWTWSEREERLAAGFATDLAVSYMHLTDSESRGSFEAKTAGLSGGISYSTRAFSHVAPTIGTRGFLHETSDGRLFRALTLSMTLESR